MKEHPVLFSAPMVRAILEGRKTQTRRAARLNIAGRLGRLSNQCHPEDPRAIAACPYGQPGDRLWVRETCSAEELTAETEKDRSLDGLDGVRYAADGHFEPIKNTPEAADAWVILNAYRGKHGATVPAIHMPRWASRITLEITDVRVQRLQEINIPDAMAEGIKNLCTPDHNDYGILGLAIAQHPVRAFSLLWDAINALHGFGWNANPWVWALTFKRVEQTI